MNKKTKVVDKSDELLSKKRGRRIKVAIGRTGKSQKDFALDDLHTSQQHLSGIVTGKHNLTRDNAERLRVGSMWARTVQVENGKTVQNDLLFTSWDGTPFDLERLTTWFPHFLRAHDLPAVHFHSLRHTYASLMIAAHVPITTVSGRLGHAQTSTTTDIYAGFIRTADAAASDAMEIVFDNIREKSRA